jgi:NADPH-dependent ferric siderophore reductase
MSRVDIVLHGAGVAADWARAAAAGDVMHVTGPKDSRAWPAADCHILAGDETALPAIARRLEERDPQVRSPVIVEVADRDEEQPLGDPVT